MGISFSHFTTAGCSRKRKAMAGTITTLSGLLCTPKAPVDMVTVQSLGLHAPHVVYEVHLQGNPDIKKGDVLTIGSVDYQIHDVSPWTWMPTNDTRLKLVIEDLTNNAV
jgi:hypothetical protein